MDIRWKGAAIAAALLVGAPAHGQGATSTGAQGTGSTGSRGSTSSTMGTGSGSSAKAAKPLSKDLAKALQELHAGNQFEVQLGQQAAQAAQSPEVKQFAEMMQKDHQKNDEQLEGLATSVGATLTGEEFQEKQKDGQKKIDELKEKQGSDFDKAYMSLMVKDHKKDVKDVEKAAKEARKENRTQLAAFLETTHTTLAGHLQKAERIEKELGQAGSQAKHGSSSSQMGTGSGAAGAGGGTGNGGAEGSRTGAAGPGGGTSGVPSGGK